MDPLKSPSPGDVSPFVNSFSTVNKSLEILRRIDPTQMGRTGGGFVGTPPKPQDTVYVRNDTGADLPAFSVVKLGTPVISAVDAPHTVARTPVFPGTAPSASTDCFAVTLEPIPYVPGGNGPLGLAAVLGVVPVSLTVNDANDTNASPSAGVTARLSSDTTGPAKIIWKESGTGTKQAVVLLVGATSGTSSVSSWKAPVRVATTQDGTLSTAYENGDTIDGVVLATGDRILIKNQASASSNGIYTVNASGAPTRATDADAGSELLGATVFVSEGTANADTVWACTANATITVNTTPLPWRLVDLITPASASMSHALDFDDTWTDLHLAITLPQAGTYLVYGGMEGQGIPPGSTSAFIAFRTFDVTAGSAVTVGGSSGNITRSDGTTQPIFGRVGFIFQWTVTVPTQFKMQGNRVSAGWTSASIGNGSVVATQIA